MAIGFFLAVATLLSISGVNLDWEICVNTRKINNYYHFFASIHEKYWNHVKFVRIKFKQLGDEKY